MGRKVKINMKKILALLLVLVMATSVIACGKTETSEDTTPPVEKVETPVENDETGDVNTEDKQETTTESQKPSSTPSEKPQESAKPSEKPAEKPQEEPKTVGTKLLAEFNKKANSGTPLSIAESFANGGGLPFMAGAMEVEPGLLAGFDNYEVKGFKSGATFGPMMGSIAFIGYVFEVEDGVNASDFAANLKKNANKRWQICVEAEEVVTGTVGNKVFFVMCPKAFEE